MFKSSGTLVLRHLWCDSAFCVRLTSWIQRTSVANT